MIKYLPRAGAYWDVRAGEPVRVSENGPRCDHATSTWFQAMDRRADDMAVYNGQCCTSCGRVLKVEKRD